MSIRLICSDIDGTLLQYGRKGLEGEIFEQIRELHRWTRRRGGISGRRTDPGGDGDPAPGGLPEENGRDFRNAYGV